MNILGYKIVALICTCWTNPSQWNAHTSDGDVLYIRYRWGRLTVQHAIVENAEIIGLGSYLYNENHGDEYDGFMSEETMLKHLAPVENIEQNENVL